MSAGLSWNKSLPYSNPANSERRMIDAADQYRYVLEQPVTRPAGAAYSYNGGLTALLAAILTKVSGRPVDVLAKEVLFDPLGIEDVDWVRYANGTANAVSGLRMRPRDLVKVGQLVLNGGTWDGELLVSEGWIEESTSAHITARGCSSTATNGGWGARSSTARRSNGSPPLATAANASTSSRASIWRLW